MTATAELIGALVAGGMNAAEAAGLVARAAVEMTGALTKKSAGAARQQRYRERHKASLRNASDADETVTNRNESVTRDAGIFEAEAVTNRHKASQSVTSDNTPLSISKIDNRKRGERLSSDWSPSDADRAFAKSLGWSEGQVDSEAANFRDYWIAKPGAGGVKLDWPATWRKWIRSSKVKPAGNVPGAAPIAPDWEAAAKMWASIRRWPRGCGNDPDSPACRAPPEILRKHGIQPLGAA